MLHAAVDVTVFATTEKAALQVYALLAPRVAVCLNGPTSPTRVSQCVRPGALACVRPFAMTDSHRSGALHCDVRVAAGTAYRVPPPLPWSTCLLAPSHAQIRGGEGVVEHRDRVGMSEAASAVRAHERGSSAPAVLLSQRLQAMVHRKLCAPADVARATQAPRVR